MTILTVRPGKQALEPHLDDRITQVVLRLTHPKAVGLGQLESTNF
jgi:hypothetical protein